MEIQGKKSSADSGKNAELNSGNRKGKFREKSDSGFAEKKQRIRGKKAGGFGEKKDSGFGKPSRADSADRALPSI